MVTIILYKPKINFVHLTSKSIITIAYIPWAIVGLTSACGISKFREYKYFGGKEFNPISDAAI